MGAVTFSLDARLVNTLKSVLPLNVFIETGTFKGDTAAAVESFFDKVVTIELSQALAADAVKRFNESTKVQVLQGDSAVKLRELRPDLEGVSALYWLDAHWCVANDTAGELSQCPLMNELKAIGHLNDKSVILIDDARLFLAPPLSPHEISQWPRFHQIIMFLMTMSPDHELMIVNDVIVFFPGQVRNAMQLYAQSYGLDWLVASNCLKENGSFINGLLAKEGVIQRQSDELAQSFLVQEEKENVIQALKAAHESAQRQIALSENAVSQKTVELVSKEEVIQALKAAHESAQRQITLSENAYNQKANEVFAFEVQNFAQEAREKALHERLEEQKSSLQSYVDLQNKLASYNSIEINQALCRSLEEKEVVIQGLIKAVAAYRAAFKLFDICLRPFSIVRKIVASVGTRVRSLFVPNLGRLYQHPPIPLRIPPHKRRTAELSNVPKVSIVTPSFKQAAYIGRTIDSILEQNYANLEYFVQDGGSDDGTVEVVNRYGSRITGLESKSDSGQSQAINLGFTRTTGEIMAWLNSDDLLLPGAINAIVEYFNSHPEVDVVYGDRLLIDENDMQIGRWIMPGHDSAVLSWVDYVPQETMFWRRRIWEKTGSKIDESFRFAMDWDLLIRFRDAGAVFAHMPRFLGAFRIHAHQKTSAQISQVGHQEMDRIRGRVLGRVPSHEDIKKAIWPFMVKHIVMDRFVELKTKLSKL
jgi:hypothetical protein